MGWPYWVRCCRVRLTPWEKGYAMTRWVVLFEDGPEMLAVRSDQGRRDAHVAYAKAHPELLIGGGLKPAPGEDICGALWVVNAQDKQQIETLVENDPFYEPAFRSYRIFTWGKILEDQTATL